MGGIRDNLRNHSHGDIHLGKAARRSSFAATTAILVSMFFTPCIEIETYFFRASMAGWSGIAVVGLTYVTVTVAGILFLVDIVRRGLEFRGFELFERFEKQIMGTILMIMALANLFSFRQGMKGGLGARRSCLATKMTE